MGNRSAFQEPHLAARFLFPSDGFCVVLRASPGIVEAMVDRVSEALASVPGGAESVFTAHAPVCFLSNQLEVPWDLDNEAKEACGEVGHSDG